MFQILLGLAFVGSSLARPVDAQNALSQKLTIRAENRDLRQVLIQLQRIANVRFTYSSAIIPSRQKVTVNAVNQPLSDILDQVFRSSGVRYKLVGRQIILQKSVTQGVRSEELRLNLRNNPFSIPDRTIRGTIKDESGEPLPGVSILVKGTQTGTTSNIDGTFQIEVPETPSNLVFSFVGYESKEIVVGPESVLDVVLKVDVKSLSEIVVVGYGTQKKVNLTGSVSVVNGDQLTRRPVGQASSALQGTVPGLTVTQRSGQPGRDNSNLRIRGVGTTGDSDPLVIVDGVEANINSVDPNEIENISVLKDASSAAIYGSRAANGVILITTKRGNEKGFSVNYNAYTGWQSPTDMPKIVNGLDHMKLINEAYTNTGRSALYTDQQIQDYITKGPGDRDQFPDTDWQKLTMTQNGFMQSHYVGVTGGTDRLKVLGSLSYFDQDGIIPNTNFKRYNLRVNTDAKITDKLSTSMDIFLQRRDLTEPSVGTAYIFHWMRRIPSNQAGVLSTGQYGEGWNGDHPLGKARDGGLARENEISSIINLSLKYKPTDWLTGSVMYSPKFGLPYVKKFVNTLQTYRWDGTPSYATPVRNNLREQMDRSWYNNLRATIAVDKSFNQVHNLNVLAGYQQEDQTDRLLSAYREVFLLPDYEEINSGNRLNEMTGGTAKHWALRSFFGRVNYNFKEKYLFEANARYDGSSRFGKGNKYALFPSFSAGWRIIEEPFMKSLSSTVTDLKLRASWGKLGNQNLVDDNKTPILYPFAAFVGIGNSNYVIGNSLVTGSALSELANSNIKWETTTVSNIGLDLALWNNFNFSFEYYQRRTTDILLRLDVPTMIGLTAPFQNAGIVDNKGWDLTASYRNKAGDFTYSVAMNLSDVKNKVVDMRGVSRSDRQVNNEGSPIQAFYGYVADGFFQTAAEVSEHATQFGNVAAGDIRYLDLNNDGKINNQDQRVIGSNIPRYTYSTNIDLGYKGFDLSIFFQGVGKADGMLTGHGIMPFYEGSTIQEYQRNSWRPDNTGAEFPRLAFNEANNIQNSSFWLRSASYLRLKNLQLGYNFPQEWLKGRVQKLRLYTSGQNLLTFDKFYPGFDVEAPVGNAGWYPQMKVFTVGLDVRF
ncbi:TonB-dependent receptor [Ravibacter arvi]|uniref:TonB-dependent receptor n=2 Tax=Ravibacter arvi TaxID=2051041 RepID=A0ABP8MC85_9BACT